MIVLKTESHGRQVFQQLGALMAPPPEFHLRPARRSCSGPRSAIPPPVWRGSACYGVPGDEGSRYEHLRVHGAADDHLHRGAVSRCSTTAVMQIRRSRVRGHHAPLRARERRRVAERRAQASSWDRPSAAARSVPSCRRMTESELNRDDGGHGAHLGRKSWRRLHPVSASRARHPAHRGDHGGAGL